MKQRILDLNCDLGERESPQRTLGLIRWITSANVACGGHAGSVATMERCVLACQRAHVRLGAHPGFADQTHFGRADWKIQPKELALLLVHQVGALQQIAQTARVPLHHIKLHGSLYHATENNPDLGRCYLETVRRFWPSCKVVVLARGPLAQRARRLGLPVWREAFCDRAYQDNGQLLPRSHPEALITQLHTLRQRVIQLQQSGTVITHSGKALPLQADTLCVHGDHKNATRHAQVVAQQLQLGKNR